ncbi:MAG: putative DNA binding domain-containing protein [Erysipelotrichaceae bacterium]|nr:putative DNA binding domain-containing protein [Erysipelotrichaceae bacterium]
MELFEYENTYPLSQYYEILNELINRWENEIVEFKEAKGQYDTNKVGQYFSAISNEANLKRQQYGWLVFGVSEDKDKKIVGTNFKSGVGLLEKFKYEISKNTNDNMTFIDIIELNPIVNEKAYRVLMFKIPAAITGYPTSWKNRYYARSGESLVLLQQFKIDEIRSQERSDWSKQTIKNSNINHLDKDAIKLAREKYKEKLNGKYVNEEIDSMTDEEFLTKIKLLFNGEVTNAAMVLLGNSDYDNLMPSPPMIMWRLYDSQGEVKDYELFPIPFINVIDKIFLKIRNLTYRYLPNQTTLFPTNTQQYDTWLLRELLNNCIAHSNYQLGGRIYVNEFEDQIIMSNPGNFIPVNIESVLQISYNPPFYRNQLLAETMVKFHMIDTATMGIRKVFRIQKDKYFPLPDYDLSVYNQVSVTVYGKILNENYTHILYDHPEFDLETVFLLDRIQKGLSISKESIAYLRKLKLIEGRKPNLFLAASVSSSKEDEAQYIKNKAFNDQYYKDMMVRYLKEFNRATKKEFKGLLWNKLPDILDDDQKEKKISNLLSSLRRANIIETDPDNRIQWKLKE